MGKVQQYKSGISAFISSEKGQRFFNFAYSIGAAIVIWGALFKILHLPGGNTLLSIGMGTEVLMFVLTAFDRPPKEYNWEDVFPALRGEKGDTDDCRPLMAGPASSISQGAGTYAHGHGHIQASDGNIADLGIGSVTQEYLDQLATITADMKQLHATTAALNQVSQTLLESYRAITENSAEISQSARGYVNQMQALDRNISGLNTIYELQLRSVSSQIDSIDRVNRGIKDIRDMYEKSASQSARYCEETEKMARYMQQLNNVYEKMLTAMTVNMYRPGMTPPDIDGVTVNGHHSKVEARNNI